MKKVIALLICIITALPVFADGAAWSADLVFKPVGEGKFIYCNNQESVTRNMLSSKTNAKPEYIMNNEGLTKGKYALYVSLLNHTELKNSDGSIKEIGFDIEADAYIKAKEDTTIEITAMGFEVPSIIETYADGALSKNEGDWSCIQAIADYTDREIRNIRGESDYIPNPFDKITVKLKKNEVTWLSKYISNYCSVNWLKPVHILSDFEIISGSIDLNIAALKSDGKVGDRSNHVANAAFGKYYRDRQYKGIADSLPYMYSDEMHYIINDSVYSGTELPVTVYNQYEPNGKTVTKWFTHLNPLEDIWSRTISAESDILPLKYKDSTKLTYYGNLVPGSKKNDTWCFDVFHSDLAAYEGKSKTEKANHNPNALLSTKNENTGTACNMGNFGVFVNYKVSIENTGAKTRYFNYNLRTTANNVVNVKNENGEYMLPYSVCKGQTDAKRDDVMATVELPSGKTTTFYIEILLPMNNPGGMENSFIITDEAPVIIQTKSESASTLRLDGFTGNEYYKWGTDCLYVSKDKVNWHEKPLTETSKKAFDGRWNSYKITAAGNGYIARYAPFQDSLSYYSDMLKYFKNVYILDSTFNVVRTQSFDSFVSDASYSNGIYYVKSGNIYYSADGINWAQSKELTALPVSNNNGHSFCVKNNKYYFLTSNDKFIPVDFGDNQPEFIESFGEYYCYSKENILFVSKDGIYYSQHEFPETIKNVACLNGQLSINEGKYMYSANSVSDNIITVVNNKVCKLNNIPTKQNLPLREIMEELNARVLWDDLLQAVTVIYNGNSYMFKDEAIYINGALSEKNYVLDEIDGVKFIDYDIMKEVFGIDISYENGIVTVSGDKDDIIDSEYYSGFSVPQSGVIVTKEQALEVAKTILNIDGLTAQLNENSGYWEIKNEQNIIMILRKIDGKIMINNN